MQRIALRRGVEVKDPLGATLAFLEAYSAHDSRLLSSPGSFGEGDLRFANGGGARISAAEQAAILERRAHIERALQRIEWDATLMGPVPWVPPRGFR